MTSELEGHLNALENEIPAWDLQQQRIRLNILERSTLYMSEDIWKRYQAIAKRFHDAIMQKMGATMGS